MIKKQSEKINVDILNESMKKSIIQYQAARFDF
jgi:hypothetical protein